MTPIPRISWLFLVASTVGAFQPPLYGQKLSVAHKRAPALPSKLSPQSSHMISSSVLFDKEQSDDESPQVPEEDSEKNDDDDDDDDVEEAVAVEAEVIIDEPKEKGLLPRIKLYLRGNKEDDGLTFRQRMAKMGLSVVLSYGWVSNMSYCVSVSIAWYIFNKQTGLSPLAKGQWKKFLAVYGGFYVFNNIVRPIRLAASVAVSPYFEKLVELVQRKLRLKKKATAVTLTVLVVNGIGTTAIMFALVSLAASLSGVPIFPPKALS